MTRLPLCVPLLLPLLLPVSVRCLGVECQPNLAAVCPKLLEDRTVEHALASSQLCHFIDITIWVKAGIHNVLLAEDAHKA